MAKSNVAEPAEKNEGGDAPLIDLNEASLKKLISRAKKRGYITMTSSTRPFRRTRCLRSRSRT